MLGVYGGHGGARSVRGNFEMIAVIHGDSLWLPVQFWKLDDFPRKEDFGLKFGVCG